MSNICKEELNEFWLRREPAHRRRNRQKVKKQQMQVWRSKIFVKLLWYWWNDFWISLISHPAQGWIFWPDLNRNFLSAERPVVFRWRGHSSAEWGRDGKIQNWGKILPKKSWAKFFCDISVNWGCRPWLMIVQELLRKYGCCSWTKPGGCLEGEKHLESIGDYYNNSFEKNGHMLPKGQR